jgi:hypothetical protein
MAMIMSITGGFGTIFAQTHRGNLGFFSVQWRLKFLKIVIHPRTRGEVCSG